MLTRCCRCRLFTKACCSKQVHNFRCNSITISFSFFLSFWICVFGENRCLLHLHVKCYIPSLLFSLKIGWKLWDDKNWSPKSTLYKIWFQKLGCRQEIDNLWGRLNGASLICSNSFLKNIFAYGTWWLKWSVICPTVQPSHLELVEEISLFGFLVFFSFFPS